MAKPMKMQPNDALREMLARDGELDRILDGRGLTFTRVEQPPAPPPPAPFRPDPPPWSENYVGDEQEAS